MGSVLEFDDLGNNISWLRSEKSFKEDYSKGDIRIIKINEKWSVQFKQRLPSGKKPRTILSNLGTTSDGSEMILNLFSKNIFDNPKPTNLLKHFMEIGTKPTENHLILDFFAGSGTTAQAVMELNEEDGGNRQFICVQMPEATDPKSEAYKSGYQSISDITKARIGKVIEKIAKQREGKIEFAEKPLPVFQHFALAESNFKVWRTDIQGKENIALQLFEHQQAEKPASTPENMFVELCLKNGLGLNVNYTKEDGFYKVGNRGARVENRGERVENRELASNPSPLISTLTPKIWFCFEKYTDPKKQIILSEKPQRLVFLNSCFESDVDLSNFQLELVEYGIKLTII